MAGEDSRGTSSRDMLMGVGGIWDFGCSHGQEEDMELRRRDDGDHKYL